MVVSAQRWGEGDRHMEARFVIVGTSNIVAPEEDEVSIGESTILDTVSGGAVDGDGDAAKIGGYSIWDGVVRDGEEEG